MTSVSQCHQPIHQSFRVSDGIGIVLRRAAFRGGGTHPPCDRRLQTGWHPSSLGSGGRRETCHLATELAVDSNVASDSECGAVTRGGQDREAEDHSRDDWSQTRPIKSRAGTRKKPGIVPTPWIARERNRQYDSRASLSFPKLNVRPLSALRGRVAPGRHMRENWAFRGRYPYRKRSVWTGRSFAGSAPPHCAVRPLVSALTEAADDVAQGDGRVFKLRGEEVG